MLASWFSLRVVLWQFSRGIHIRTTNLCRMVSQMNFDKCDDRNVTVAWEWCSANLSVLTTHVVISNDKLLALLVCVRKRIVQVASHGVCKHHGMDCWQIESAKLCSSYQSKEIFKVGMNKHLRLTRHDRPEHRHKYTVYLLTPKRGACLHSGTLMNILFKSSQKVSVHSLYTHGRIIIRNNAVYVVNSCILNTCTSPTPP